LIDIERLTDQELDEMQATFEKVKTAWTQRHAPTSLSPKEK
jgi:hypothetical protein